MRSEDILDSQLKRLKWYLNEIRDEELKSLDIDLDEYETGRYNTDYSNIINLVEEALYERPQEDCRYKEEEPMRSENIYKSAIDKFGENAQIRMCFEEMSELQKELCKYLRQKGNYEHTCEEIADVEIMLEQLKLMFNCQDKIQQYKEQKLHRLKLLLQEVD